MSSFEKFRSFVYFSLNYLFSWHWTVWIPYVFWISLTPYWIYGLQIFSPILSVVPLLCCFPPCTDTFLFDIVPLVYFCFYCLCFWGHIQKFIVQPSVKLFPMFSSSNFTVWDLVFESVMHFELLFVFGMREAFNFVFLHVNIQLFQHRYWRDYLFHMCVLCTLVEGQLTVWLQDTKST